MIIEDKFNKYFCIGMNYEEKREACEGFYRFACPGASGLRPGR